HDVLGRGMLEKIEDAFPLEQPAEEVEIRLAVLHAVLEIAVGAVEAQVEVAESRLLADILEDRRHALLLKDAAVRRSRQEPEPGPDDGAVLVETIAVAGLLEFSDHAVEVPHRRRVRRCERDGQRLAEGLIGIEITAVAEQGDLAMKGQAQLLDMAHARKYELIRLERALDLYGPVVLVCAGHAKFSCPRPVLRASLDPSSCDRRARRRSGDRLQPQ